MHQQSVFFPYCLSSLKLTPKTNEIPIQEFEILNLATKLSSTVASTDMYMHVNIRCSLNAVEPGRHLDSTLQMHNPGHSVRNLN